MVNNENPLHVSYNRIFYFYLLLSMTDVYQPHFTDEEIYAQILKQSFKLMQLIHIIKSVNANLSSKPMCFHYITRCHLELIQYFTFHMSKLAPRENTYESQKLCLVSYRHKLGPKIPKSEFSAYKKPGYGLNKWDLFLFQLFMILCYCHCFIYSKLIEENKERETLFKINEAFVLYIYKSY